MSTQLEELVARLTTLVDAMTPSERDALGAELAEVSRSLSAAQRRLNRALST